MLVYFFAGAVFFFLSLTHHHRLSSLCTEWFCSLLLCGIRHIHPSFERCIRSSFPEGTMAIFPPLPLSLSCFFFSYSSPPTFHRARNASKNCLQNKLLSFIEWISSQGHFYCLMRFLLGIAVGCLKLLTKYFMGPANEILFEFYFLLTIIPMYERTNAWMWVRVCVMIDTNITMLALRRSIV